MTLKPPEKAAILAGKRPPLVREGQCPFEKGEIIVLQSQRSYDGPVAQVSITILNVKRGKKGEHLPEYSVRDDRGSYLRHRGGVTRSPSESVDPEAPLVDPEYQELLAEEGRLETIKSGNKHRLEDKLAGKNAKPSSERSERAKKRNQESISRALRNAGS